MRRLLIIVGMLLVVAPAAHARWAPEERFSSTTLNTMAPIAAYDDVGRAFLAFTSGANGQIAMRTEMVVRDGGAWSAPVFLGDASAQTVPVVLRAAGDGHAAAALLDTTAGPNELLVTRYAGSAWSPPVALSDAGRDAAGVSLAVEPTGEVHVAWVEDGTRIRVARFAGGLWSIADVSAAAQSSMTRVVVDQDGVATVVWIDAHGGAEAWFAARRVSGAWASAVLAASPGAADRGSALVLQDGRPLLVWGRAVTLGQFATSVVEAVRFDGAGWGAVERVSDEARVFGTSAVTLGDGSAMAVWNAGTGGLDYDVYVSTRTASGWSARTQVNATPGAIEPQLAAVGANGAAATWRWTDAAYGAVRVGGSWSSERLAPEGSVGTEPAVAGSRDGSALVAWADVPVLIHEGVVRRLVAPPGAPSAAAAKAGDGDAMVSWTAPTLTNGEPISGYVVTSVPDGRTCATAAIGRSCTVTGLVNGRAYRFQVAAANAEGAGPAAETAAVTPRSRPSVRVASPISAGGVLRTWVEVSGPGTLTQVGTSPAVAPRVCRVQRTVRRAGRVLLVCVPRLAVRLALPCRPVKVRLVTTFRTPDRVTTRAARTTRLDACLRVPAVVG